VSTVEESRVRDRISERLTRERLRLEVKRSRTPFILLLALLTGALLSFALLLTKLHLPAPWASTYQLHVAAADVTGVQPGNEVRIAGVQVGHVTSVSLNDGTPVLGLSIDPKYRPVYRNARVEIRPNTPLQDMYLDIVSRGTRAAGAIPDGGELAAAHTQPSVQIGQVIDIFDASVRPRVTATVNALGQGLGDHGAQLRQALVELAPFLGVAQRFARETAIRRLETRRLVHNFALLSGELANRTNELHGLIRDGATTMERLASVERPLGAFIDQLPPTLRELPPAFAAVNATAAQLDPAARSLLPVADALAPALAALEQLSPTAQRALAALDRTFPGLTRLVRATEPLSTRLGRSFSLLRPQVPRLDNATAALLPCETALQKFFQWTLSVSKMSGLHGDMQRGLGLIGPQTFEGLATTKLNGDQGLLSIAPTCSKVPPGP
jgi:virulence factor Mce-like protein